jgi:hypothetical protein
LTAVATPDRRSAPRSRTFWKGTILFPGGLRSSECTVRNYTDKGARLECGNVPDIPDHFELKIPQKGGTYDCTVVWRRMPEIGVAFGTSESADELADKLRLLEQQNRRLLRHLNERE